MFRNSELEIRVTWIGIWRQGQSFAEQNFSSFCLTCIPLAAEAVHRTYTNVKLSSNMQLLLSNINYIVRIYMSKTT
jgi:hypothetical protein